MGSSAAGDGERIPLPYRQSRKARVHAAGRRERKFPRELGLGRSVADARQAAIGVLRARVAFWDGILDSVRG